MSRVLTIHDNLADLSRWIDDIARQQIPFAAAKTLTTLAMQAQNQVRQELPQRFQIRNTWTQKGIQIERAEKKDWPFIRARVGSRDWYMAKQETGGVFGAKKGQHIAVPNERIITRSSQGFIPSSQKPKALLSHSTQRKAFLKTLPSGNQAILRPYTSKSSQLLYILAKKTHLQPRFELVQTVTKAIQGRYTQEFNQALEQA